MIRNCGVTIHTVNYYMASFSYCASAVANYQLCERNLWSVANAEDASRIFDQLFSNPEFNEYNKQKHHRFSVAFRKFVEYRSASDPASVNPSQQSLLAVKKTPTTSQENAPLLVRYKELLAKRFANGFRMESSLEIIKLRRYYLEQYGVELSDEDNLVAQNVRSITILHDGKAYLPESMLSQEKKEKLLLYIEEKFNSGSNAVSYDVLFSKFKEAFQDERIYTPKMLKTYLAFVNTGNYVLKRSCLAKDDAVQYALEDEIREYLKNAAGPVNIDGLAAELSHFSTEIIKKTLHDNSAFISNAKGEYFYADCVHIDNSKLEWISQFLDEGIEERDFVTGKELVEAIEAHFPDVKGTYHWITLSGMRKLIGHKLSDKFSFKGNIISKYGEELSMAEVYASYCRKRTRFTLDELNLLKEELASSVIYFDEVYANSLRISQDKFVAPETARFDVDATDEAIGRFCTGQYISLQEIRDFGTLPYAGFPWNEYLLEHYVANYSQKFILLHIRYNSTRCVGAIVKKESSFRKFNDLLVDLLAKSDIALEEESALEYLCQEGYLAKRSYDDIGSILTEAKVVRSKKG